MDRGLELVEERAPQLVECGIAVPLLDSSVAAARQVQALALALLPVAPILVPLALERHWWTQGRDHLYWWHRPGAKGREH